ncbi:CcmD family protein [Candidatus Binatia bacterium]|nr:CcmD family protein [Candidatus Binatia bacterium]
MENLDFLFAAYTAVWVMLFAYLHVLARRNRALEREIEELRALLEQSDHR